MPLQEVTNTKTKAACAAPVKSVATASKTAADANVATVGAVLAGWGNWAEDNGAACLALHAETCQVTMPSVRTRPEYKNYQGHAGVREWVEFLAANIEFDGLEVISLAADPADASVVRSNFSAKPKVLATGRQLPEAMSWQTVHHLADGKLASYEIDFDVTALEELWGADEAEANIATVGAGLAAWGKWADDDGAACLALFAEDCELTVPPVRTRPEYKHYRGRAGVRQWVEFFAANVDHQELEVLELGADAAGVVRLRTSGTFAHKATGREAAVGGTALFTVEGGLIRKQELVFCPADVAALEELWGADEAEANIATVGAVLAAWGKWADDDGAACLALFAKDCELTVPPVPNAAPEALYGRAHRGRAGVRQWVEFIGAEVDFTGYELVSITADPAGAIRLKCRYQPAVKATGHKCAETITSEAIYRVEDGKVKEHHLPAWGAQFEAMYDTSTTEA